MTVRNALLLGALSSVVAGCPHTSTLCLVPTNLSARQLTVSLHEGADCSEPSTITEVVYYRPGGNDSYEWSLATSPPALLSEVTYGVIPPGFHQGQPPRPLAPGQKLRIRAIGPGRMSFIEVILQ